MTGKRSRDHAAAYRRRDERARAEGFASYYDKRVRGGKLDTPRPKGETLRHRRGHAGPADLEQLLRAGKVAVLSQEPVGQPGEDGRYRQVRVTAQLSDGSQRRFTLRSQGPTGDQLSRENLKSLRAAISDAGTDVYTNPSIDVLALGDRDDGAEEDWLDIEDDEAA